MTSNQVDLAELERIAKAATRGRWQWYGNTKIKEVYLSTVDRGRQFVMDFVRWGMTGAQPRFQVDQRMVPLAELAASEHRIGPRFDVPYRGHFSGIGHPDAEHIAANSPDVTIALVTRIRELETACRWAVTALRMHKHDSPTAADTEDIIAKGVVL